MKLKKILAFAVSLAMVLSIVPAFGIVAGAAAPELDALALISLADYTFVGQTTPPSGNSGAIPWGDSRLTGINWEGWSGAAQLYWASGEWVGVPNSLFIDGNASKGVMYVSDAVKTGTSSKDYIVFTWDSGTVDAWTDMKIIDADGNAIDTFRYRSCNAEGINPHWSNDGSSASFADVCTDYTYDDADGGLDTGNGVADTRTVYYMVYGNNQSGTGYTASYYYKTASVSTATWIGTKSYATGSVNGLSGIEIGNGSGAQRMFNFAIYAGTYPADAYTASAVTTVDGNEITLISTAVTGDATLSVPAKTFLYNGKIYHIDAQDAKVTSAAPKATVEAKVAQEYAATNLATTAGSATTLGNSYPTVAGNGSTANADDDKTPLMTGSWQNYGSAREVTVTMNAPVLSEGQVAVLHLAVGALRKNIDNSTVTTYRLKATANGKTAYTSSLESNNNSTAVSLNPPQEMTANVTELLDGSGSVAIAFNGHSGGVGLVNVSNGEIGGVNEGVASYIEVVGGYKVTLPEGAYITEAGTKRTVTNNVVYVAPNADIVVYDSTGAAMAVTANGAEHLDGKVTVTAADTVIAVADTTIASVTNPEVIVISGNTPVLPATVKATTGGGSETEANVTSWNTTGLDFTYNEADSAQGYTLVEVPGTVDKYGEIKAQVKVLPATLTLDDMNSKNGTPGNVATLPMQFKDEIYIEFNLKINDASKDAMVQIGADGNLFSAGQIGIGTKNVLNTTGGDGNGTRDTRVLFDPASSGDEFRILVCANANGNNSVGKYTVTATRLSDSASVTVSDMTFRKDAEYINSIVLLTNGGGADGDLTMTNIKVYNATLEALKTVDIKFVNENQEVIYSASEMVAKDGGSFTVPAQDVFVIDSTNAGVFYSIPETIVNEAGMSQQVSVVPNKYAVIEDMLVSGDEVWGIGKADGNSVWVSGGNDANRGPLTDANGDAVRGEADPEPADKSRVGFVEFPVIDVAAGQKVMAYFYVRDWDAKTFSNGNTSIRLAANVLNDSSWKSLSDGSSYVSANAPILEAYPNAIFSEPHDNSLGYIAFDVTDAMKAAKGLTTLDLKLTTAWGAAKIADREACVVGGAYEGKAAYIEVVDAGAFEVTAANGSATLTKNGSAMSGTATVAAGDDVRLVSEGAEVITADNGSGKLNYRPNTNLNLTAATNLGEINGYAFGINMEPGAAVRLGEGVTDQNKIAGNSGIRFIATIDSTSNITSAADQVGIVITAEGNTQEVEIPAVNYQDATTFTAALTNLNQSNYIREFTATPYAKVTFADGTSVTFKGNELNPANESTRSIYEVSALGLTETPVDEIGKTVKDVMNAYVNSVGIRLTLTDGTFARDAKLGDTALFEVTQSGTTVTIKPVNANVDLKAAEAWWIDYVRINNNNKTARNYISNPQFDETTGALTFTFEEPAAEQTTEPATDPAA